MITQSELKKHVHYNPETGVFTWLVGYKNKRIDRKAGDIINTVSGIGYISATIKGEYYSAHRLAWFYMHGYWPECIDHINHIRSDNRLVNLRETTTQGNGKNQSMRKNNKSGITGVRWSKPHNKWIARIVVNAKEIHLGIFTDKFEAICARKSADNKYGFHENHGKTVTTA